MKTDSDHIAALRAVARSTLDNSPPVGVAMIDQYRKEFAVAVDDLGIDPDQAEQVAALVVHAAGVASHMVWPDDLARSAQLISVLACVFVRPEPPEGGAEGDMSG